MTRIKKSEQELIDSILENFNFKKCEKVMKYLNWTWVTDNKVPTIEQLKEAALDRINSAIEGLRNEKRWSYLEPYMCSSGGLCVYVWKDRYGNICDIKMEFVLTEWDTF